VPVVDDNFALLEVLGPAYRQNQRPFQVGRTREAGIEQSGKWAPSASREGA